MDPAALSFPSVPWSRWLVVIFAGASLIYFWRMHGRVSNRSIYILLVFAISTAFLTRPMEGHDETAHMSMWQEALNQLQFPGRLPTAEFNRKTYELMQSENFQKFNGVMPSDPSACPHRILSAANFGKTYRSLQVLH